jgi:short-subunit dehydrogenase
VEVLVNNAGIMAVAPLLNQSKRHFEEAMDTNFYGAMHTTLAILPGMLERRKGSIVNIASIGGLVAVPHMLPYSASKFALVGFSRGRILTTVPIVSATSGARIQNEWDELVITKQSCLSWLA